MNSTKLKQIYPVNLPSDQKIDNDSPFFTLDPEENFSYIENFNS